MRPLKDKPVNPGGEGTRTPKKHKRSGQGTRAFSVEILTAYSHSTQGADLLLRRTLALTNSRVRPETEHDIADLITVYRQGATAASLAAAHGLSLTNVKRLYTSPVVRRMPPTQ